MQHSLSLFIFRRDLRLEDNTGLIAALEESKKVIPCFIFDPRQCVINEYKSVSSIQFMRESLEDLQQQLKNEGGKLYIFEGISEKSVEKLMHEIPIDAVYLNRDYTRFSKQRDEAIENFCKRKDIAFETFEDILLNPPESILKSDGSPYQVFSRFYAQAKQFRVPLPQKNNQRNYFGEKIKSALENFPSYVTNILIKSVDKGGRDACQKKLVHLKNIKNYKRDHNFPAKDATSGLSPHLKFTTCSVREIYHAILLKLPSPESMIRELYWRDFFTYIAFHFPHVLGSAYREKYNKLQWSDSPQLFDAWCQGKTGFPLVDAGMNQLNKTGIMHNRLRLVTASFLVKDLHIDWRLGEKYFAQKLIDYDPVVNNGNWQWVAGTGTDIQPYFRIFNPWLQQRKFDPECQYIKKWIPVLKSLSIQEIHHWDKTKASYPHIPYPAPIIDHKIQAELAKQRYKAINQSL